MVVENNMYYRFILKNDPILQDPLNDTKITHKMKNKFTDEGA